MPSTPEGVGSRYIASLFSRSLQGVYGAKSLFTLFFASISSDQGSDAEKNTEFMPDPQYCTWATGNRYFASLFFPPYRVFRVKRAFFPVSPSCHASCHGVNEDENMNLTMKTK